MDLRLEKLALATRGFMPADEGLALYESASQTTGKGPMLEIGSYCGKSSIYIGAAAVEKGKKLFCVDHHRGSEENQAGWEHHDSDLVNPETSQLDTLPSFRRTIHKAGLEDCIIAIVGDSIAVAQNWSTPLSFLFIDGGHGTEPAHNDFEAWTPHIEPTGILCIHDVFPNPADGGRPPYEIYLLALESGNFEEIGSTGSLKALKKN